MGLDLNYYEGQTPLDEDEKDGLLIPTIATRQELDEFEQLNVEEAIEWTLRLRLKSGQILTDGFVRKLHRRMYGNVWAWAGDFRRTDKNIGVGKWEIPTALRLLLDDSKYWIDHETYAPDEIAIRFKHRLVSIHCFPNGNGRHSRLMADILASTVFGRSVFTWGMASLVKPTDARRQYILALREADIGDIAPLIAFARS